MTTTIAGRIKGYTAPITLAADGSTFSGLANAPIVDRYKELVPVSAYASTLRSFRDNPICLRDHRADKPIGYFPQVDADAAGLHVTGKLGVGWDDADTVREMIRQRVLRSLSIGFRELEPGAVNKAGVYVFRTIEILEISVVSIPANGSAVFEVDDGGKLLNVKVLGEGRRTASRPLTAAERITVTVLRRQLAGLLVQIAAREMNRSDMRHDRQVAQLRAQVRDLETQIARRGVA
jgi:HK97 family phage prohead protease